VEGFCDWLLIANRQPITAQNHFKNIRLYYKKYKTLKYSNVVEWLATLKKEGRKNNYLRSLVGTVRVYSQFKKLKDKKLLNLPFPPKNKSYKATLADEEIEAFLKLPPHGNQGRRKYAIYTLFFFIFSMTGARPGEIAKLKVEEVDFGRSIFILKETKTGDTRLVPIPPNLIDRIKEHISRKKAKDYLFCPNREKPIDSVDWDYNFKTRIKRLGINRPRLSVYSLRHTTITRLLEEDVNLFKVQKLVGHRQIKTTAIYTHLTTKDIQKTIRRLPLIKKALNPLELLKEIEDTVIQLGLDNDNRFNFSFERTDRGLSLSLFLKQK